MKTPPEFTPFPKMARLSREIIITEKIDGTNAQILIDDDGNIFAGSRKRWITPEQDNFGFAAWVEKNKDELIKLGTGRHFGEWWGSGIQRGYGLKKGERRFSLFNVQRWHEHGEEPRLIPKSDPRIVKYTEELPESLSLVPRLYQGEFCTEKINETLSDLILNGSHASNGFMNPEGVIVFHVAGNVGFKKTVQHDDIPKSLHTS